MCGISGALARNPRNDVGPLVERLNAALAHRGPDGTGLHFLRGQSAAFGHRRLSIVDLECGAQPMSNGAGTVWVVLNGELYNHLDLRRELERVGYVFRTRADTEVLVHGWEEWGPGVLERLNGMYAFALYDGRGDGAGTCWLARDPVGIKPLYVGVTENAWWFASELAAARDAGVLDSDLRRDAIGQYLVYRFVPSPATPYRNAWKLPPGTVVRFNLDALPATPAFEPFQTTFAPASQPRTRDEWEEALRVGLRTAVRRQLMSDVPVASLLSGGVDSTVVTGMMHDALPEAPQAFAIGFDDMADGGELALARRAAGALQVPLAELRVTEREYLSAWPEQIGAMGEPIANSGLLLVGMLCRRVRETHKVVLTGQGADEPLGGYPRHAAERFAWAAQIGRPLLALLPEGSAGSDRVSRLRRIAAAEEEGRRFAEILAVFGPADAALLTGRAATIEQMVDPVRRHLPDVNDGDSVNRLLTVDARLSLADDLLVVADHMSMASSVELRVPFLDLEFLALVERMPSRFKLSAFGERKALYRKAVRPLLPGSLRNPLVGWRARTGRKLGFTTPLERWFSNWVARDAEGFLLGPGARLPSVLAGDAVRRLVVEARDGGRPRARQLLSLYVLEHWMRQTTGGT